MKRFSFKLFSFKTEKTPLYKKILKTLGPGIITGAADDDPSGIATYSQTGAQYGFGLLWTVIFILPMMYIIQEMSARIALVTGKGITQVIKNHYSKYILFFLVSLLVIANIINLGTDLGAMAAATQLLLPVDFRILVILFTILILTLEIFTSYKKYSKILKFLTLSLFAYIITGLIIHNDWLQVLKYSVIPSIQFNFSFIFLIVGVLGTTISPYMIFWQANEEIEEEIEKKGVFNFVGIPTIATNVIKKVRFDTFSGMLLSQVTTWFIIIATASTLHAHHIITITTANQAAAALAPLVQGFPHAGDIAKTLFALGIIGTGLLAVPIFAGSASYAVCEMFGLKEGLYRSIKSGKAFYIVITAATLIGLLINFIGINPIQALVYTAVINGIIVTPLIGMLLLITNNKGIMGRYTNGVITNSIAIITFVIMCIATLSIFVSMFVH